MILQARYVVAVDREPIERGAIRVEEGRIVEVGRSRDVSAAAGCPIVDHGDAVILPGFVNGHTHLELSHFSGRRPAAGGFTQWLSAVAESSLNDVQSESTVQSAVRDGLEQSTRAGVTAIGDITRFPEWTRVVLAGSVVRAVSFGEVVAIGARRGLLEERLAAAASDDGRTERLRIGISPHAPYTLEPQGLKACGETARRKSLPLCIHLAECPAEAEFTLKGSGPLAVFLKRIGVWDEQVPVAGQEPVALVQSAGLLLPATVLAHCNYVSDEGIAAIAESGASVVYCPQTHAAFGHAPHRFRDMLAAGINVCIGTDSLASSPSLSVLDELRVVHRMYPAFAADMLIRMGTLHGAKALGLDGVCGSITPGKAADLCVLPLEAPAGRSGWQVMLQAGAQPTAVYIDGRVCFGN